jgi:primosomal protein N' (replication factor Y)
MLVGGWTTTAEGALAVRRGWARAVVADRAARRARWPRVSVTGPPGRDGDVAGARVPTRAWRLLQEALRDGPVLVQVPRAGYVPALGCATCRRPARCPHCAGPVQLTGTDVVRCRWCARNLPQWACPHCGGGDLRARQVGVARTADELGRAFPGVPVVVSRPDRDLPSVPDKPVIVLATSGVEPPAHACGGYAAAVLLDGDLVLARPDLRAEEEALRRWLAAVALVRPADRGGRALLVATGSAAPAVQALVRLDPVTFAERTLAERDELGLPPARAVLTLDGESSAAEALLRSARDLPEWPPGTELLGPTPLEDGTTPAGGHEEAEEGVLPIAQPRVRWVLRPAPSDADTVTRCLRAAAAARSARRERAAVRIRMDPRDLG